MKCLVSENSVIGTTEGYEMVKECTSYFVYQKYPSLIKLGVEDIAHDIYMKLYDKKVFEKFNPSLISQNSTYTVAQSKQYYIQCSVKWALIDLFRREMKKAEYITVESLDATTSDDDSYCIGDIIASEQIQPDTEVIGKMARDQIISSLPSSSKKRQSPRGYSPLLGKVCTMDYQTIALHLEAGYSGKDIADLFTNEETGRRVTNSAVYQLIKIIRQDVSSFA